MRRRSLALLALAALLGLGNLLVWRWRAAPLFDVRAEQVDRVEIRSVEPDTRWDAEPVVRQDRYRLITDRADITLLCDVVRSLYLREFTLDLDEPDWNRATVAGVRSQRYVFYLRDGSTRTIEGLGGDMVYFDGHWCYASCGKSYGYQPVIRFTGGIEARAERIRQEETP